MMLIVASSFLFVFFLFLSMKHLIEKFEGKKNISCFDCYLFLYLISGNQACAQKESPCFNTTCVDIPVPPHFMCGQCPYGKVGYKCDIGKYLIFILKVFKMDILGQPKNTCIKNKWTRLICN